mmetsp:Transcript_58140/g.62814  ORF Transcript_58140/g.62814 Transcript_58140/m.62814 type:complete len:85 (-) Transcript_58140:271-525(-)
MYRKIPKDLLQGTKRGSIMSYSRLAFLLFLVTTHTLVFLRKPRLETDCALDDKEKILKRPIPAFNVSPPIVPNMALMAMASDKP